MSDMIFSAPLHGSKHQPLALRCAAAPPPNNSRRCSAARTRAQIPFLSPVNPSPLRPFRLRRNPAAGRLAPAP